MASLVCSVPLPALDRKLASNTDGKVKWERQTTPEGWVAGVKARELTHYACRGQPQDKYISTPACQNLKVDREALTGLSQGFVPGAGMTHYSSKAASLKPLPLAAWWTERTLLGQRRW